MQLELALLLNPDLPGAHFLKGKLMLQQKKFEAAQAYATWCIVACVRVRVCARVCGVKEVNLCGGKSSDVPVQGKAAQR